jgi:glycosyltransferase involved in cell wall biosynthesis
VAADALARERDHYLAAAHIVCMSRWAADSVVSRYGIGAQKVHVVPAGANIDEGAVPNLTTPPVELAPLRLGFIGKDWQRKGLSLVLNFAEVLSARGFPTEVVGAGFAPASGPRHPLLRVVGFVDKRNDMARFVRLIRSFHFGCLFPSVEAFGLSNVECQRLGVPVLSWAVGGIPDTVRQGSGHLFPMGTSAEDMSDVVENYLRHPETYWELRSSVASQAVEFAWQTAIPRFLEIWRDGEKSRVV